MHVFEWQAEMGRSAIGVRSKTRLYVGCFLLAMSLSGLGALLFVVGSRTVGPVPAAADSGKAPPPQAMSRPPARRTVARAKAPEKPVRIEPVLIARAADPSMAREVPADPIPVVEGNDTDATASSEPWTPRRGTYRTVCVRLCDGAYVPLSFATTRDRFKADSAQCEQGCGSPARLFVARPDAGPEDMVDLKGARYTDLPTAFLFRSAYDPGCTCRGGAGRTGAGLQAALESSPVAAPRTAAARPAEPDRSPPVRDALPRAGMIAMLADSERPGTGSVAEARVRGGEARPGKLATVDAPAAVGAVAPLTAKSKARRSASAPRGDRTKASQLRAADQALAAAAMQRSFRSGDYWRLSYWQAAD